MARANRLLVLGAEMHYVHDVFRGINQYCSCYGSWEFYIGGSNSQWIHQAQIAVQEWKADGIIAQIASRAIEKTVLRFGLPVVNISGVLDLPVPTVRMDDEAIGREAARYYLDNGFRSFGFCAATGEGYAQRRCQAFEKEITEAGYRCEIFTDRWKGILECDWATTRKRMVKWLMSLKKPVGVMCIYDMRANELAMMCRHYGIRVPDEVAIMGIGNDESICSLSHPPISSIDPDLSKLGYEAARLVHQLIKGGKGPKKPVLIPPKRMVVRRSSDVVAIEDPEIAEVMRYIRQHVSEPLGVKEILGKIPISRRMMERRFVKLIGRSPKEEIMRRKMQLAGDFLKGTELQIPAIAKCSGFVNRETFTRAFRREMGLSPTEFRRRSKIDVAVEGR